MISAYNAVEFSEQFLYFRYDPFLRWYASQFAMYWYALCTYSIVVGHHMFLLLVLVALIRSTRVDPWSAGCCWEEFKVACEGTVGGPTAVVVVVYTTHLFWHGWRFSVVMMVVYRGRWVALSAKTTSSPTSAEALVCSPRRKQLRQKDSKRRYHTHIVS